MQYFNRTSSINYLLCNKMMLHQGQPLSRLCIDKKCKNKSLICSVCQNQDHVDHETISLKHFLKSLKLIQQNFQNNSYFLQKITQIDKNKYQSMNLLKKTKMFILNKFNDLQNLIIKYYDKIKETLLYIPTSTSMQNYLNNLIIGNFENHSKALNEMSKILKIIDYNNNNQISFKQNIGKIISTSKDQIRRTQATFNQLEKINYNLFEKLQNDYNNFLIINYIPKFFFSNTYKGNKIKVLNQYVAQQTGMESSGQRFILLEPNLNTGGNFKKQWAIKINKFTGWIGVGICLKNIICKASYHFNYTNIHHGSYLISNNGYSWSHSQKNNNSFYNSFQFGVNDIIYIEYNPFQNKLKFRKNQGTGYHELSILECPNDDAYHPCVNLCSTNDTVQVINNIQW